MARKRLGEILEDRGKITQEQVFEALDFQKQHSGRLGGILVYLNFCTPEDVVDAVVEQMDYRKPHTLKNYVIDTSVIPNIPYDYAKKNRLIPIEEDGDFLIFASSVPFTEAIRDEIYSISGFNSKEVIFKEEIIDEAIDEYYKPILAQKKHFLDDERFRIGFIISFLVVLFASVVFFYMDEIQDIKRMLMEQDNIRVEEDTVDNRVVYYGQDDEENLVEFLQDMKQRTKDDIFFIEGESVRDIKKVKSRLFFYYDELFRYYNIFLRRDPTLQGRVVFIIEILGSGNVRDIAVKETEISNNKFIEGAKDIIKRWNFGKIEEDISVKLEFPFYFKIQR